MAQLAHENSWNSEFGGQQPFDEMAIALDEEINRVKQNIQAILDRANAKVQAEINSVLGVFHDLVGRHIAAIVGSATPAVEGANAPAYPYNPWDLRGGKKTMTRSHRRKGRQTLRRR